MSDTEFRPGERLMWTPDPENVPGAGSVAVIYVEPHRVGGEWHCVRRTTEEPSFAAHAEELRRPKETRND